ncbi:xanthine dehydrogenase-like [Eupeodes corollae]|uniref:xanthine dehydrogenase-like n=1 Tax=Eupeodes corollae TaxID=290404 RepID=UPI0024939B0C|nr:xanthine dehydrogenase-like [Eupeodes corollae]
MSIEFKVNGIPIEVELSSLPPDITLNTYIREHVGLTGTKFMCLEGGCGVCVCSVKKPDGQTLAVNSCLTLLNICHGWEITTIEGIGNKLDGYHPIQSRLAEYNGSQCGYCSPGMIMNMFSLLSSKKDGKLTMSEIENSFGGNICRCTGYRPILDAMKSFATDSSNDCHRTECPDIEDLPTTTDEKCLKTGEKCNGLCRQTSAAGVITYKNGCKWFWPRNLTELFKILQTLNDDKYFLVAGNTAHGVYRRSSVEDVKNFIDVSLSNLRNYRFDRDCLTLGANLSLTETMEIFLKAAKLPDFEYCQELYNHFDLIANVPVRNMGTLAGNLMIKHAHPEFPSDIFITFEALNVIVMVGNISGVEAMTLSKFLKINMKGKVILAFRLQAYPKDKCIFKSFKIMPRAQNAHAYVNSSFFLDLNPIDKKINYARICFGGINKDFIYAKSTENLLAGVNLFSSEKIQWILECLHDEIKPDFVPPDASLEYRRKLACGLFYKFILSILPEDKLQSRLRSGREVLKRPLSSGKQIFKTSTKDFAIKQPIKKLEAIVQCSGEAKYMNDFPSLPKQVWCAFVNATKVGVEILEIDASAALKIPGVVGFFEAKDIPGINSFVNTSPSFFGMLHDEQIFCAGRVSYHNQPVGMIVAENSALANFAASKVQITYSKGDPEVFTTMENVLEANKTERILDVMVSSIKELELRSPAQFSGSGHLKLGQQYHFTMEPHTTVVIPVEGSKLEVYSSTQWMDLTQCAIAKCVGINVSDVQLNVRRLGGGFGSKISRGNHAACAAALAAIKLNRPARFVQTIESMMGTIGKRWACNSFYDFHVNSQGKVLGLENRFFEDAGYIESENAIESIAGPALINCYDFKEKYKIDGKIILTDTPSHTWCRGPGSLEGFAMTETIMEHIAFETQRDPVDVRMENIAQDHKIRGLIEQFLKNSEYRMRRIEVEKFNEANRWRKKGLGITIMQFDVMHFAPFAATVAIYHADGSVVISHGGIEMGQGMNTKAVQVAAHLLDIPMEVIRIESSNTVNGANAIFTGASIGSECVCLAIRKACDTLLERLRPIRESMQEYTWQSLVENAHNQGVNLIASDQFQTGDLESYLVYGICLTEVEIDILTGNLLVNRVDILEETGESLNPAIDIGQIEGAFVMGLGYFLTEQLIYEEKTGELLTNRTWNYKPPGCKDIPIDFRIELLQESPNPAGFMRSKTTGEPAICMAVSVLFAIQEALQSARNDAGLERKFISLGAPTTPEQILLNSGVDITHFEL